MMPMLTDQHTQQYFEMFGNRAMYKDGWLARTIHRAPWEMNPERPLAEDIWELYNVNEGLQSMQMTFQKNILKN